MINKKTLAKISLFIIAAILIISLSANAGKIILPEGTKVKIKFDPNMTINSGVVGKGIPLLIYLAEPVMVGGETIIEKDALGKAEVVEVKKASKPGKPGYIKVAFVELEPRGDFKTADGSNIKLKGEIEAKGKGKKLLSILLGFGLLIKGGQGSINTDMIYEAEILESIVMQSE